MPKKKKSVAVRKSSKTKKIPKNKTVAEPLKRITRSSNPNIDVLDDNLSGNHPENTGSDKNNIKRKNAKKTVVSTKKKKQSTVSKNKINTINSNKIKDNKNKIKVAESTSDLSSTECAVKTLEKCSFSEQGKSLDEQPILKIEKVCIELSKVSDAVDVLCNVTKINEIEKTQLHLKSSLNSDLNNSSECKKLDAHSSSEGAVKNKNEKWNKKSIKLIRQKIVFDLHENSNKNNTDNSIENNKISEQNRLSNAENEILILEKTVRHDIKKVPVTVKNKIAFECNDKKEAIPQRVSSVLVPGNNITNGEYSKIIIVGGNYLRALGREWLSNKFKLSIGNVKIKPHFLYADLNEDYVLNIYEPIISIDTLEKPILILFVVGLELVLNFKRFYYNQCKIFHAAWNIPFFPKRINMQIEEKLKYLKLLKSKFDASKKFKMLVSYLPSFDIDLYIKLATSEIAKDYKSCTCDKILENDEYKCWSSQFKHMQESFNQLVFSNGLNEYELGKYFEYSIENLMYVNKVWSIYPLCHKSAYDLYKELEKIVFNILPNTLNCKTNSFTFQNIHCELVVLGDIWLRGLLKHWPISSNIKPVFYCKENITLLEMKTFIHKYTKKDQNIFYLIGIPFSEFLVYKDCDKCIEHLPLRMPTLKVDISDKEASLKSARVIASKVKIIDKNVKRLFPNCNTAYFTNYPATLTEYREHLLQSHKEKFSHHLTIKNSQILSKNFTLFLKNFDIEIADFNKSKEMNTCDISKFINLFQDTKFLFPTYIDNISPPPDCLERLISLICRYVESMDNPFNKILELPHLKTKLGISHEEDQAVEIKASIALDELSKKINNTKSRKKIEYIDNSGLKPVAALHEKVEKDFGGKHWSEIDNETSKLSHNLNYSWSQDSEIFSRNQDSSSAAADADMIISDDEEYYVIDEVIDEERVVNEEETDDRSSYLEKPSDISCTVKQQCRGIPSILSNKPDYNCIFTIPGRIIDNGEFSNVVIVGRTYLDFLSKVWPWDSLVKPHYMLFENLSVCDLKRVSEQTLIKNMKKALIVVILDIEEYLNFSLSFKAKKCPSQHLPLVFPRPFSDYTYWQDINEKLKKLQDFKTKIEKETSNFVIFSRLPRLDMRKLVTDIFDDCKKNFINCMCNEMTESDFSRLVTEYETFLGKFNNGFRERQLNQVVPEIIFEFDAFPLVYMEKSLQPDFVSLGVGKKSELNMRNDARLVSCVNSFCEILKNMAYPLDKELLCRIFPLTQPNTEITEHLTTDPDNKVELDYSIIVVGNVWLKFLINFWPESAPICKFLCANNMSLERIENYICSAVESETLIVIILPYEEFIELKEHQECIRYNCKASTLTYPVLLFDNYSDFNEVENYSALIIQKIMKLEKSIHERKIKCKIAFSTCYAFKFNVIYKSIVEVHNVNTLHQIRDLENLPIDNMQSAIDYLLVCVNSHINKHQLQKRLPICDLYSLGNEMPDEEYMVPYLTFAEDSVETRTQITNCLVQFVSKLPKKYCDLKLEYKQDAAKSSETVVEIVSLSKNKPEAKSLNSIIDNFRSSPLIKLAKPKPSFINEFVQSSSNSVISKSNKTDPKLSFDYVTPGEGGTKLPVDKPSNRIVSQLPVTQASSVLSKAEVPKEVEVIASKSLLTKSTETSSALSKAKVSKDVKVIASKPPLTQKRTAKIVSDAVTNLNKELAVINKRVTTLRRKIAVPTSVSGKDSLSKVISGDDIKDTPLKTAKAVPNAIANKDETSTGKELITLKKKVEISTLVSRRDSFQKDNSEDDVADVSLKTSKIVPNAVTGLNENEETNKKAVTVKEKVATAAVVSEKNFLEDDSGKDINEAPVSKRTRRSCRSVQQKTSPESNVANLSTPKESSSNFPPNQTANVNGLVEKSASRRLTRSKSKNLVGNRKVDISLDESKETESTLSVESTVVESSGVDVMETSAQINATPDDLEFSTKPIKFPASVKLEKCDNECNTDRLVEKKALTPEDELNVLNSELEGVFNFDIADPMLETDEHLELRDSEKNNSIRQPVTAPVCEGEVEIVEAAPISEVEIVDLTEDISSDEIGKENFNNGIFELPGEDLPATFEHRRVVIVGTIGIKSFGDLWVRNSEIKPYFLLFDEDYAAAHKYYKFFEKALDHELVKNVKCILFFVLPVFFLSSRKRSYFQCKASHPDILVPIVPNPEITAKALAELENLKDAATKANHLTIISYHPDVKPVDGISYALVEIRSKYKTCCCRKLLLENSVKKLDNQFKELCESFNSSIYSLGLNESRDSYFSFGLQLFWTNNGKFIVGKHIYRTSNDLRSFCSQICDIAQYKSVPLDLNYLCSKEVKQFLIGDLWLKKLVYSWPNHHEKPILYFQKELTFDTITKVLKNLVVLEKKIIVYLFIPHSEFVDYKNIKPKNCKMICRSISFPYPHDIIFKNALSKQKDIRRKIDALTKEFRNLSKVKLIFLPCYPLNFSNLYHMIVKQHFVQEPRCKNKSLVLLERKRNITPGLLTSILSKLITEVDADLIVINSENKCKEPDTLYNEIYENTALLYDSKYLPNPVPLFNSCRKIGFKISNILKINATKFDDIKNTFVCDMFSDADILKKRFKNVDTSLKKFSVSLAKQSNSNSKIVQQTIQKKKILSPVRPMVTNVNSQLAQTQVGWSSSPVRPMVTNVNSQLAQTQVGWSSNSIPLLMPPISRNPVWPSVNIPPTRQTDGTDSYNQPHFNVPPPRQTGGTDSYNQPHFNVPPPRLNEFYNQPQLGIHPLMGMSGTYCYNQPHMPPLATEMIGAGPYNQPVLSMPMPVRPNLYQQLPHIPPPLNPSQITSPVAPTSPQHTQDLQRNQKEDCNRSRFEDDEKHKESDLKRKRDQDERRELFEKLRRKHLMECERYRETPLDHPDFLRIRDSWFTLKGSSASSRLFYDYWAIKRESLFEEAWSKKKEAFLSHFPGSFVLDDDLERSKRHKGYDSTVKKNHGRKSSRSPRKSQKSRPRKISSSDDDILSEHVKEINTMVKKTPEDNARRDRSKFVKDINPVPSTSRSTQSYDSKPSFYGRTKSLEEKLFEVTDLLSKISDKLGALGSSIPVLRNKISHAVKQNKHLVDVLNEDEKMLLKLISEKISRVLNTERMSIVQKAVLEEASERMKWLLKFLKIISDESENYGMDLDHIAKSTIGKGAADILSCIKAGLLFKKVNFSQDELMKLYMKVKTIQKDLVKSQ